jgi:hypothetical protein
LSHLNSAFKIFVCTQTHTWFKLEVNKLFSIRIKAWYTLFLDLFLECILLTSVFLIIMSQNLNSVPSFDGTNYGYWKAQMHFFLKSIDVWKIIETGWIKPEETDEITVVQTSARLSNDKALHALYQALSPSEFVRISNCEIAKDA